MSNDPLFQSTARTLADLERRIALLESGGRPSFSEQPVTSVSTAVAMTVASELILSASGYFYATGPKLSYDFKIVSTSTAVASWSLLCNEVGGTAYTIASGLGSTGQNAGVTDLPNGAKKKYEVRLYVARYSGAGTVGAYLNNPFMIVR